MGRLFGTNGVRGVVGERMTPQFATSLGHALASHLPAGAKVAVGTDARTSGPMLKAAMVAGLLSGGASVLDAAVVPTPALQFFVKQRADVKAGVLITASHNPPEFNGIKFVEGDGTEMAEETENEIEELYFAKKFRAVPWEKVGTVTPEPDVTYAYIEAILKLVDEDAVRRAKLTVCVDTSNGVGGLSVPYVLEEMGCRVIGLNTQLDGRFPGHESEPTPEHAKDLCELVKATGANLGIMTDGDADRAIFVDEKGEYVWGDRSFALLAASAVKAHKGGVVCTPVSTSSVVEDVVARAGGKVVYTVVGAPKVAREMMATKAILGGEENGGVLFPEHQHCRDSGMTAARMVELVAKEGKPLSELIASLPKYALVKQKVKVPDAKKDAVMGALVEEVKGGKEKAKKLDTRDGVKIYVDDGWVLIRKSGTEPIVRVFAESKDEAKAKALVERFTKRVTELAARA